MKTHVNGGRIRGLDAIEAQLEMDLRSAGALAANSDDVATLSELSEASSIPVSKSKAMFSGGATTLIFILDGANAVSSLVMRSPMPANMVVPQDKTVFE